jgi:hypothetical protein
MQGKWYSSKHELQKSAIWENRNLIFCDQYLYWKVEL